MCNIAISFFVSISIQFDLHLYLDILPFVMAICAAIIPFLCPAGGGGLQPSLLGLRTPSFKGWPRLSGRDTAPLGT